MVAEQIYIAPEEYLRQEREAALRSEYVSGEIIPMAGASVNHNCIKENVAGECYIILRGTRCRSYSSDQRVHVPTDSLYAYPDVVVVCGPNEYSDEVKDTLTNPTLLVEVLSPGTAACDRGEKFALYRHAPTFLEYLLIDSERIRAEVYRKHAEGYWFLASEAQTLTGQIELSSIGLTLPLQTVYTGTEDILR